MPSLADLAIPGFYLSDRTLPANIIADPAVHSKVCVGSAVNCNLLRISQGSAPANCIAPWHICPMECFLKKTAETDQIRLNKMSLICQLISHKPSLLGKLHQVNGVIGVVTYLPGGMVIDARIVIVGLASTVINACIHKDKGKWSGKVTSDMILDGLRKIRTLPMRNTKINHIISHLHAFSSLFLESTNGQ
jgi:hypothetical protein